MSLFNLSNACNKYLYFLPVLCRFNYKHIPLAFQDFMLTGMGND